MESVDPLLTNKKMSDYDISSSSSSSEIFEISDEEPALKKRKYKEWAVDQSKPKPESTERRHKKRQKDSSKSESDESSTMMQDVYEGKEMERDDDDDDSGRKDKDGEGDGDRGRHEDLGADQDVRTEEDVGADGEDEGDEDDESDEGDEHGGQSENETGDEDIGEESEEDMWVDADVVNERRTDDRKSESDANRNEEAWTSDYLYESSPVTVLEAVCKIMHGYIRYKWSQSSLKYNLDMIRSFLPADNEMPYNLHSLMAYVKAFTDFPDNFVVRHYYCRKCEISLSSNVCEICSEQNVGFFFDFDIAHQIKNLFEKHHMDENMNMYNGITDPNLIKDITDGEEYHRVNGREGRGNFDLTLILNTDGLSLIKSAKSQTWPILLSVAELPPELRERNLIFGGLWHDKELKPPMNLFLKPIVEQAKKGFKDGVEWTNKKGETIISKFVVPLLVADAPARAEVLNMTNFNGKFGCNLCEIQMVTITINGKKYKIYPFNKEGNQLRTNERILAMGERVIKKKLLKGIRGIKGKSALAALPLSDMATISIPEYMHSMLLGLAKLICEIWFDETKKDWSQIRERVKEINVLLLKIHPPNFFNRFPRNIDLYKHYKASEFLNWVLFYSLPCLENFLGKKYLDHWKLFTNSLYYLLRNDIEKSKLEEIEENLKLFVKDFGELYGERHRTYNLHQVLHLVEIVRRWGPLHTTSAFPFEGFNQVIANCVHGTKNLGAEVSNKILLMQRVNQLRWRINQKNYAPRDQKGFQLIEKPVSIDSECIKEFFVRENISLDEIKMYRKVEVNKRIFTSLESRKIQSNSYTVVLEANNSKFYGEIYIFFVAEDKLRLILKSFEINNENILSEHHLSIKETDQLSLFKFEEILSIQHVVRVGNYIIQLPFTHKSVL